MKRTRQSAFALLLALCVTLGLLPALTPAASAAETYGLYVGGVEITLCVINPLAVPAA